MLTRSQGPQSQSTSSLKRTTLKRTTLKRTTKHLTSKALNERGNYTMSTQPSKPNVSLDVRNHSFNVGIAIDYSPTMSLWLCYLAHWSERNLANNKHIYNGLVWLFDTLEALGDCFPYYTKSQLETMINNSIKEGLVVKGNFNKHKYDRTTWYALTDKAKKYFPHLCTEKYQKRLEASLNLKSENSEMLFGEIRNADRGNRTTIPITDPITDHMCGGTDVTHTQKIFNLKQQKAEETTLNCPEAKAIFEERFAGKAVTMREIFDQCRDHYEQKSLWATKDKFVKWLQRERPENYKKIESDKSPQNAKPYQVEYQCYVSQFRNDRDRLGLIPSTEIPLSYEEWVIGEGDRLTSSR